MGIRIKKVLGWGFKYWKPENDPRFTSDALERFDSMSLEEFTNLFLEYLDKKIKNNDKIETYGYKLLKNQIKGLELKFNIRNFYYTPYGVDDYKICPIVFTTPLQNNFLRYGDLIDAYEYDTNPIKTPNVIYINGENGKPAWIYPWCSCVHVDTGKRVKGNPYFEFCNGNDEAFSSKEGREFMLEQYGVKSDLEFQRKIVPILPEELKVFFEITKIFPNPKTKYKLRPMILTYFS